MSEIVRVRIHTTQKSVFFTIVNIKHFGRIPNTALSIDRDREPLANVKVLSYTLVKMYLAGNSLIIVSLWAARIAGFGRIRLTYNRASANLKVTFDSALLLSKKKACRAFVNLILSCRHLVDKVERYMCLSECARTFL